MNESNYSNKISPPTCDGVNRPQVACRENAKSMLRSKIERKERELQNLKVLHDSLPEMMPPQAEEALWGLFCEMR